jgi:hypothetical protein
VERVRRIILRALAEEKAKSGITQADIARTLGIHRSVVTRELRGVQDITLGRVGEFAWALGRTPVLTFEEKPSNYFVTTDRTPVANRASRSSTANTSMWTHSP